MITFVTDVVRAGELDILSSIKMQTLSITDLSGVVIDTIPAPKRGWTHQLLEQVAAEYAEQTRQGANAYLGESWVGSTEV